MGERVQGEKGAGLWAHQGSDEGRLEEAEATPSCVGERVQGEKGAGLWAHQGSDEGRLEEVEGTPPPPPCVGERVQGERVLVSGHIGAVMKEG